MVEAQKRKNLDNEPLVSIVVPVYKVEKYLDRCVQSIIAQTYRNIEVYLVDDGSPDNCGMMCDDYAREYSYIRVIHQENAGQAAARNAAVKQTKGEYILFVDSDDFITTDHVEYLVSLLQNNNCDISIGGFRYKYEGKDLPIKTTQEHAEVMSAEQAIERMNYGKGFGAMACGKLMPRQAVLNHPFPQGQIYEDLATMYKIFGDVDKVVYGNKTIYYWIQRPESTTRSKFENRQLYGLTAAMEQIEYLSRRYPGIVESAQARYTAKVIELIGMALESGASFETFRQLKKEMKYCSSFLENKNVRSTQKIRCVAILLGFYPSRLIFYLHECMKRVVF